MDDLSILGELDGTTAIIGSGGKSTLMAALARSLPGTRLMATTCRMLPYPGIPTLLDPDRDEIERALASERVLCVGTAAPQGKLASPWEPSLRPTVTDVDPRTGEGLLTGLPEDVDWLEDIADHLLVEADGSKHLPLKAHMAWEPVIPAAARRRICVVGASGFGRPIHEVVHRWKVMAQLTGCAGDIPASPEMVARTIALEGFVGGEEDWVLVNQADDERTMDLARALGRALGREGVAAQVAAGSLREGRLVALG